MSTNGFDPFAAPMPLSPAAQQAAAAWPQQYAGAPPATTGGHYPASPQPGYANTATSVYPNPNAQGYPAPPQPGYSPPNMMAETARLPQQGALGPISDIADIPTLDDIRLRNYNEQDSKLTVNNPDPRLEYRWVNDDPHNFAIRYRQGYRPVQRIGAATSEADSRKVPPWMQGTQAQNEVKDNSTPMLQAGSRADGSGRRNILMARPKEFRELQSRNFRAMVGERNKVLDPRSAPAPIRPDGQPGTQPENALNASDRTSFRGSINIAGSA